MQKITKFDQNERYIFLHVLLTRKDGKKEDISALLDTGAPVTEFSDQALKHAGFLETTQNDISLPSGLQTQKY
ncbi:MAG: hypothetical protein CO021_06075 [Deltaproteobacteria bacterium CG_4_9_14_0_2_um_filter_42_21]|nr:MAG: hypothetical protein CO021_06075 [Deltaproteobacteria bacterium CG_4_9_14_0_2_um_filter_42_21]